MESLFFVEETTRFRFLPAVALHIEYVVAAHCCLKGVVILTFYVDASALTKAYIETINFPNCCTKFAI